MSDFICGDKTRLPVSVRVSSRAKHLKLSLAFTGDLEVIVPARLSKTIGMTVGGNEYDPDNLDDPDGPISAPIKDFLEQHRRWIERAAERSGQQRETYRESLSTGLPTHMDFPLCDEIWLVEYHQTQAKSVRYKTDGLRRFKGAQRVFALKLSGATLDEVLCRSALVRFVALYAKEVIPPFAWEICREIGASPKSISVNNRKSAWGVCTKNGDIRIDRRVIFLPKDLARQVILHEIAHLKYLNHSPSFYNELYSYDRSTREAEKAVKVANQLIPAWFIAGR